MSKQPRDKRCCGKKMTVQHYQYNPQPIERAPFLQYDVFQLLQCVHCTHEKAWFWQGHINKQLRPSIQIHREQIAR